MPRRVWNIVLPWVEVIQDIRINRELVCLYESYPTQKLPMKFVSFLKINKGKEQETLFFEKTTKTLQPQ